MTVTEERLQSLERRVLALEKKLAAQSESMAAFVVSSPDNGSIESLIDLIAKEIAKYCMSIEVDPWHRLLASKIILMVQRNTDTIRISRAVGMEWRAWINERETRERIGDAKLYEEINRALSEQKGGRK